MPARILLVDDSKSFRDFLALLLTRSGYDVEAVEDVPTAISSLELRPPDLVLTDLELPEFSGLEFLRRLRGNESTADVPVVLMTAWDSSEVKAEALALGCNEFLIKPVSNAKLLEVVKQYLPQSG